MAVQIAKHMGFTLNEEDIPVIAEPSPRMAYILAIADSCCRVVEETLNESEDRTKNQ